MNSWYLKAFRKALRVFSAAKKSYLLVDEAALLQKFAIEANAPLEWASLQSFC